LHGSDVPNGGSDPGLRLVLGDLARNAAALTAPSAALAARARESLAADLPIEVLPNFVDVDLFHPQRAPRNGPRVLVHASNFRAVKRPLDLLRILQRVGDKVPAKLLLAGEGPMRDEVETQARTLGLDVEFAGATPDLAPLLRRGDLFLLPSAAESFGLAALEAMASGLPVVGSRVGGLPEVVGETGILCEPGDVVAMSDAAVRLLQDDALHARLSDAARERAVQLFAAPPALDRWEHLYDRVRKDCQA
jgi:N-acetyl-alpha-D-glucosaminyl L-malate synthase BshA